MSPLVFPRVLWRALIHVVCSLTDIQEYSQEQLCKVQTHQHTHGIIFKHRRVASAFQAFTKRHFYDTTLTDLCQWVITPAAHLKDSCHSCHVLFNHDYTE